MIHWLDEPIVHSVLTGLLLLGFIGVCWGVYIRIWQIYIWQTCGDAITYALTNGYQPCLSGFLPAVRLSRQGEMIRWSGGLRGEQLHVDEVGYPWAKTEQELCSWLAHSQKLNCD